MKCFRKWSLATMLLIGVASLGWCVEPVLGASYTTVFTNGPAGNRVNMVFLGDGYTAAEIDTLYPAHVNEMLAHMFTGGEDPFPRYHKFFNAYRVNVISNESGADIPPEGVFRDTALDAKYYGDGDTERLLTVNSGKAILALANAKLSADGIVPSMRMVTVNSTRYGGSGGTFAVYAGGNPAAPEIALHELGHSFAGLADEYVYSGSGVYTGSEPSEPNVTKSPTGEKWAHWLGYEQPGIGTIGVYEGAKYFETGLYRPSLNSKMRSLGPPFDAVSREQIILKIYSLVDPLDAWLSNNDLIDGTIPLWVEPIDTEVIKLEWYVNGLLIPDANETTFSLTDYGFGRGTYEVRALAFDDTEWVRIQLEKLRQDIVWQVVLIPEPQTLVLLLVGAVLIGGRLRGAAKRSI